MRAALWFLGLFAVAAAGALFASRNEGTVMLFLPPYRISLSLNLLLLLLLLLFALLYGALRALSVLFEMPREARRWRAAQRERGATLALLDALIHQRAGRYVRARKAAEAALARQGALTDSSAAPAHATALRVLAHSVAADSAHALQAHEQRDAHLAQALAAVEGSPSALAQEVRDGLQLHAARWALDDHDANAALALLQALPQGTARRTLALRTRLQAARLAGHARDALETARGLLKHGAFAPAAGHALVRGLARDWIASATDAPTLQRIWQSLSPDERATPELATLAADRLAASGGDLALARDWLLPAWERMAERPERFSPPERLRLVQALEANLRHSAARPNASWLARIEAAQQAHPRDALLHYLAGMACLHRQLWGRAQHLLQQAVQGLDDAVLRRETWRALARLAEQRGDSTAAALAWRQAAQ